ncbi:single-stranded DNA-binding protein [Paenibacillus alkaliterrae]|uniref:single-stranded DNA-binding protein n=1 Tax=Paenibacillus alkaliterrae TaxID=320909 RepID=UPI001F35CBAA|nr:single-stranded DNA-binding protein [Paenibacillus alkaliterrae]MCF2938937.1 single-stranded DNA-binding protein [Paenibacillus alkaliterrae]
MNVAALVGRLTRDPDLRYTSTGVATCTFSIAVEDPFAKTDPKADFLPIVTWKQQAEACANYLRKGSLCSIEGRIKTRNYENKDGQRVYVTEILANGVRFLEPKKNGDQQSSNQTSNQNSDSRSDEPPIDDLPF